MRRTNSENKKHRLKNYQKAHLVPLLNLHAKSPIAQLEGKRLPCDNFFRGQIEEPLPISPIFNDLGR